VNKIFQKAIPVLHTLETAGYEAYFVGGCVRDHLMQREIHDIDIATSATPLEVKQLFAKTFDVGIEHGTVVVLFQDDAYEVTTFRTDGEYVDFRRPTTVQFVRNLQEDLARRDFTMNALAMDTEEEIYDFWDGQADIANGVIRAVREPSERFKEDALRMLRAIRFQSQLGFRLDSDTRVAIKKLAANITHISQERKTVEFEKCLLGEYCELAFESMIETNLTKYLFGLENLFALPLHKLNTLEEKWAFLLLALQLDPIVTMKQWKCTNRQIKQVSAIIRLFEQVKQVNWQKKLLFDNGFEVSLAVERIIALQTETEISGIVTEQFASFPIQSVHHLAVNGDLLLEWYDARPGPWIKELLDQITVAVLENQVANEKGLIYEWLVKQNLLEKKL